MAKIKKIKKQKKQQLVEIARSYSQKVNTGNYTSRDYFCSQKMEVPLKKAEEISEELFRFCRQEVGKAISEDFPKIVAVAVVADVGKQKRSYVPVGQIVADRKAKTEDALTDLAGEVAMEVN